MSTPTAFNVEVLAVEGAVAVDAMSSSSSRAAALLKNVGPVSVWVGTRSVDDALNGYRLWPGEEVTIASQAGVYLTTFPGHVGRVAVLEVSG